MKNPNNSLNEGFSKAWDSLPRGKQQETRKIIMEDCGWDSFTTFYAKKSGKVALRKTELPVIKKHFRAFKLDAWTGDFL